VILSLHIEPETLAPGSKHLASPFGRLPKLLSESVPDVARMVSNLIFARNNNQGISATALSILLNFLNPKFFEQD